jgi:hypothetical protein
MQTPSHREDILQKLEQPPIPQTTDLERKTEPVEQLTIRPERGDEQMSRQTVAAKGLAQMFGLDFRAAILTVIVDLMLFAGDVATLGALTPIGVGVAGALAYIVYRMQIKWYGDDHDSALIKAMVVGLLTVIPVPLTPLIAIPGGLIGVVKAIRRK